MSGTPGREFSSEWKRNRSKNLHIVCVCVCVCVDVRVDVEGGSSPFRGFLSNVYLLWFLFCESLSVGLHRQCSKHNWKASFTHGFGITALLFSVAQQGKPCVIIVALVS